jgi:hypothetical protein
MSLLLYDVAGRGIFDHAAKGFILKREWTVVAPSGSPEGVGPYDAMHDPHFLSF